MALKSTNTKSSVQKQLENVFPYWSAEKYEKVRTQKFEKGSSSFAGSLFRFVRQPERRRRESPFGGLVFFGEWDVWDFSKLEVEPHDWVIKELQSLGKYENYGHYLESTTLDSTWEKASCINGTMEKNVKKDSHVQNFEDGKILETVEKFIKASQDIDNVLSPLVWVQSPIRADENNVSEAPSLNDAHHEKTEQTVVLEEKEEGELDDEVSTMNMEVSEQN
eukprot:jgi/Galph1/3114/GphlegSOOS_G1777.1